MAKRRLDNLLVERGFVKTLREAEALALSGVVLVDEQRIEKPGTLLDPASEFRIKSKARKYVSRGGLKLEAALEHFEVDVHGNICLDLGASTGGFTDCLLQHGAAKVYAFDVGRGQLDWKLRQDPRVVLRENVNVRYLNPSMAEDPVDLATIDLSFISLRLVLPQLKEFTRSEVIALVKPQFEARREEVGDGGIIDDPDLCNRVVVRVKNFIARENFVLLAEMASPLKGQKGNQEYFLHLRWEPWT